jgi:uncharacterized protein (TIGR03067 family)
MHKSPLFQVAVLLLLGLLTGCTKGVSTSPLQEKDSTRRVLSEKELQRLQGIWEVTSRIFDGVEQLQPEESVRMTVRGDSFEVTKNGKPFIKGALHLDPTQHPGVLDYYPTQGKVPEEPLRAVYELKDDEFRYCYVGPGRPRPGELSSRRGSERTLFTYRRLKPKT